MDKEVRKIRECFLCSSSCLVHRHHIFGASNRSKSEVYGLVVDLCIDCHTGHKGVHNNAVKQELLHIWGQEKFMAEQGKTKDEFRTIFGKNYI